MTFIEVVATVLGVIVGLLTLVGLLALAVHVMSNNPNDFE